MRYRHGLYYGHIGNHIWAFILCYNLWPWMTLKGQTSKIMHFAACILKKSSFKSSSLWKTIDSHLKLWFTNMTSDLERSYHMFSANISKTMRDTDMVCITDIYEIIYGLSFYAMTFDLGWPWRSNEQNHVF